MPPEQVTESIESTDPTVDITTDATETADPPAAPVAAAPAPAPSKMLTIPTAAMARIKAEAVEKGRKAALEEMNTKARALGFTDYEAMTNAALRKVGRKAAPVAVLPEDDDTGEGTDLDEDSEAEAAVTATDKEREAATKAKPRLLTRLEKQNAALIEERKKLNRLRNADTKRVQLLQQQLDEKEVESDLKMAALAAGVQADNVDFAIDRLKRHMKTQTPEQIAAFNEATYFKVLREKQPYLFGVEERAVTTAAPGTAPADSGKPLTPGQAKKTEAVAGKVDAMKMSHQEFTEHLRRQGLAKANGSYTS